MKEVKNKNKLIAQNKKAYHDYFIEETYQAGIALSGTEVKSLRQGKCNLKDSYVDFEKREAFIVNFHISPYEQGNIFNKDPLRRRKLLLHKYEISKLSTAVARDGYTVIPVRIYFEGSFVKLDIGVAKGKKLYDKRESLMKKEHMREVDREFKERSRV